MLHVVNVLPHSLTNHSVCFPNVLLTTPGFLSSRSSSFGFKIIWDIFLFVEKLVQFLFFLKCKAFFKCILSLLSFTRINILIIHLSTDINIDEEHSSIRIYPCVPVSCTPNSLDTLLIFPPVYGSILSSSISIENCMFSCVLLRFKRKLSRVVLPCCHKTNESSTCLYLHLASTGHFPDPTLAPEFCPELLEN